jgi:hypothetical protein
VGLFIPVTDGTAFNYDEAVLVLDEAVIVAGETVFISWWNFFIHI